VINFKQFLKEKWKLDAGIYSHETNVGNHNIRMQYVQSSGRNDNKAPRTGGHYKVNFTVNDRSSDSQILHPPHQRAALDFAHKSINRFIQKKKPDQLSYSGTDPKRDELYKHLSKKLAKKYGGEAQGYTGVKFKK
jgi:hypothetical protein